METISIQNQFLQVNFDAKNPALITDIAFTPNGKQFELVENLGFSVMSLTEKEYSEQSMFFKENAVRDFCDHRLEKNKNGNGISIHTKNALLEFDLKFSIPHKKHYLKQEANVKNITDKNLILAVITPVFYRLPNDFFKRIEMKSWGTPAFFSNDNIGAVFSLDFPGMHAIRYRLEICLEYRPMVLLKPGETYETFPSGIIVVPDGDPHSARRSFHTYIKDSSTIMENYPIPFCTWGPWLRDPNEYQSLAAIPHLNKAGSNIFQLDLGYIHKPDRGKMIASHTKPTTENIDDTIIKERFPSGLQKIKDATNEQNIGFGLHFDINRNINEVPSSFDLPVRMQASNAIHNYYCMAGPYYEWLKDYIHAFIDKYDPIMIKIDFNWLHEMCDKGQGFYDNGYNIIDQHFLNLIDLLKSFKQKNKDMYNYVACGNGFSTPYLSPYIDQVHTEDPGCDALFRKMFGKFPIYRILAVTRRSSWFDRYYDKWFPPHLIKNDIASHSYQQRTPTALFPEDEPHVISEGIDWEYTLFSTICCTRVRDFRCNVLNMTDEELDFHKKWMEWSSGDNEVRNNVVILSELPTGDMDPDIFMHIKDEKAFLYIVPGLGETPSRMDIELNEQHDIPATSENLDYKIIFPFEDSHSTVKKTSSGKFKLSLPGPKNCPAIIAELQFSEDKKQENIIDRKQIQFINHIEKIQEAYPAKIHTEISRVQKYFQQEKPLVMSWGKSITFHEIRDQLIYKTTRDLGSLLSGESIDMHNGEIDKLPEQNLIIVGHGQQENLLQVNELPDLIKEFNIPSIKLPNGELWNSGIVYSTPHPDNASKIILLIIGRTPDETALALKTLDEELIKKFNVIQDNILSEQGSLGESKSYQIKIPANKKAFIQFTPALSYFSERTEFDYDRQIKYGSVQCEVSIQGENTPIFSERIVPILRKDSFPYTLTPNRYLNMVSYAGQEIALSVHCKPLTEKSKTPISLGKPKLICLD